MLQPPRRATAHGPGDGTATIHAPAEPLRARRRVALLPWILALAWLAATAWMRPLALPDEGRYVGVAWEMLRSGQWAVPTLDGMPFFHKPPLFYWVTAASMAVFGPGVLAARAASLLGALIAAMSVAFLVRRWQGERASRRVQLVLLTTPLFFGGAQFANLDMLVAGCISAAIVLAAHALLCLERGRPGRGALAGAFVFAALGMLAKGLIGGVLPALVIIAWALATRRARSLRWLAWPPGLFIFTAIAAPWFVLMQSRYPSFFEYFFVHQHLERFAGSGFNNPQAAWFYLPVLALTTLPWFMWAGHAARELRRARAAQRDVQWLMAAWLAVVVIFFSLPQSKLVGYIFPALPPLAVLLASGATSRLARSAREQSLWRLWAGASALVCVGVLLAVQAHPHNSFVPLRDAVRARLTPGDRVLMLDGFAYDAPMLLRLTEPVWVVDRWSDPAIALHDDSRKEFHDAALFAAPDQRAHLVEPAGALAAVCAAGVTWVIGKPDSPTRYPWLDRLETVAATTERRVWRWDASAGGAAASLCR